MSNYNELKLTYQGGRQETITLTGNTIDYGAYQDRDIVAVEVPEIVQTIGDYAFCDNNNLANIVLNEGLQRIEGQAFQHGVYTAVTIPSTVIFIGVNAFNIEDEQTGERPFTITCLATTPPELEDWEGTTFGNPNLIAAIYVPDGSVSAYQKACPWYDYASKIQGGAPAPADDILTNLNIKAAYVGDVEVVKMYLGNDVVWELAPEPVYSAMPLTFEITGDGNIVWKASSTNTIAKTIEYSKNGGEWTSITSSTAGTVIQVVTGDIVQFRGDNTAYATSNNNNNNFSPSTATFKIYGNIMSLIDSTGYSTAYELSEIQTFNSLFVSCTGLTDVSNLVLPATVLQTNCYSRMFRDCTSLVTAPSILPALVLKASCYSNMFNNCTSLTNAPELPASVLVSSCYSSMFYRSPLIDYVKCLAIDLSVTNATTNWLGNSIYPPHATGTFVKHPDATWTSGAGGIPEGWTVEDANI